jgi:glycosyltransferase involved in cell wall biosynthesis
VKATPRVSIVISAFHSDTTIADCLESLRDQTFRDFEVIVVNSSPEERTRRIVEERFTEVRFEQAPARLLPHAARNRGVEHARGELLVFTDPDCRARPDWLERLVQSLDQGHRLVCGAIELNETGWFARGVHLCKYSFRLSGLRGGPSSVAGTANAGCSREVWNAVGPFDGDRFAGDGLFSWRAAARGWQAWFEPRAIVEHRYIGSVGSLWSERITRGRDFAETRMAFERWSAKRAALYLAVMPLLPLLVLARTGREAFEAGWGASFILTLPLQFVGQLAWSLGETGALWRRLTLTSRV